MRWHVTGCKHFLRVGKRFVNSHKTPLRLPGQPSIIPGYFIQGAFKRHRKILPMLRYQRLFAKIPPSSVLGFAVLSVPLALQPLHASQGAAPDWLWPLTIANVLVLALLTWSLVLNRQRRALNQRIARRTTELQQTRDQLQGTLGMLQRVTANVPGVVFSFVQDPDSGVYRFPYISSQVETLFDIPAAELHQDGSALINRVHPDDHQEYLRTIANATLRRDHWHHQARFKTRDGKYRWFEAQSKPQPQTDGTAIWYGYFSDIQRHKETEFALRASENKFRTLVENASDLIYTLTPQATFEFVSNNWEQILGYSAEQIMGQPVHQSVHPDDYPACKAFMDKVFRTGERQQGFEYRVQHKNGDWRWHISNASLICDENTGERRYLGIARDITENRLAQDEIIYQARFQKMIAQLSSGFARMGSRDIDQRVSEGLAQAGEFFQVGRCYLYRFTQGGSAMSMTHEWHHHSVYSLLDEHQNILLSDFPWWQEQVQQRLMANKVLHIEDISDLPDSAAAEKVEFTRQGLKSLFCVPYLSDGHIAGFFGVDAMEPRHWRSDQADLLVVLANLFSEAQDKHRLEQDLIRLAVTDPLTGLYNRRYLMERLHAMSNEYDRSRKLHSIIILDLDHFKIINDNHGHLAGDQVLVSIAEILQHNIRPSDVAIRYGGEEFLLLLSGTDKPQALQLAERLLSSIRDTVIPFNGLELRITASVGLACVDEVGDHQDLDQLIQMADHRLYQAKANGRNCVEH